jgi:hypothetical protein
MQRIPAPALPVCAACMGIALAVALVGCASSRLSSQAPPGVRLAGDWKLDSALSDDLGKALQELRQQSEKSRRHMRDRSVAADSEQTEGPGRGGGRRGAGQPGDQQNGGAGEGDSSASEGVGPGVGPMPHLSAVDALMSNVPQGDYLRIGVSADSFTVTSGDSSNQYTPGEEADVSAETGDAQQMSGWDGDSYVIDTKPQLGPEIIQTFGLTKEGRLSMTLRLSGGGTKFTFTRIYDRTTRVAPLAPPTLN